MINKAIIVGNLGGDPETRYTQSGTQVTSFTVATTERYKGKDGNMVDETEWHRIVAWNRLAEICGDYLKKGSKVYVEGKIKTRKWQDQSGNDRYTTEIVAREMKMLDSRSSGGSQGGQGNSFPEPSGNDFYGCGTGSEVPF